MEDKIIKKYSFFTMLRRVLWSICWILLVFPFPRASAKKWTAFVYRLFGAKIGKNVCIYSSARVLMPWNLIMGDNACLADNTIISNSRPFVIKENAVLSQYSCVYCGTHNIYEDTFESEGGTVTLEENCWVASHCYVGPGVIVGRGSRVGADSAIRKNVPPYAVSFGNPNKVVGFRFSPSEIVDYEKHIFSPEDCIPLEKLQKNYEKYFLKRIKEIKEFVK